MIRFLLSVFLLLGTCKAQVNLIVSPDFENPQSTNPGGNWATLLPGTPDYFSAFWAPPPGSNWGSPLNWAGYQKAKSGTAYMGIVIQNSSLAIDTNKMFVEHFRTFLNDTLKHNTCYLGGLYFVNGNYSKRFANRLGIYFSNTLPTKSNTNSTEFDEFHQPQIEIDSNQFFTDTLNWMLLSGVFKAKGDEKWVVYGNFYNKARTKYIAKAPSTVSVNVPGFTLVDSLFAYVLIDDVFLYEIPSAQAKPDTALCIGQSLGIGLNNDTTTAAYNWLPQTGLSCTNCPNPIATPVVNTTYTLTKTVKGCSTQSKITLTVNPKPQPVLTVSKTKTCINNNTVVLHGSPPGGVFSGQNVSDTLFVPAIPGTYTLNYLFTDNNNCSNTSSVKTITVYPLPQKPRIDKKDSLLCVSNAYASLTALPSNGVYVGENLSGNIFKTKVPGSYTIYYTVTDATACSNSDTLVISVKDCANGAFSIPNVFSPNADGVNDVWKVVLPYGVRLIKIEIYNRWGTPMYERDNSISSGISNLIWDGYAVSGIACDAGTYFYILQTQTESQGVEVNKGTITLIR